MSWFIEKFNKIGKPCLDSLRKKEKTHINKIRNEREVTTDTIEIPRIILQDYERPYAAKFNNLEEMEKFPEIHNLPSLNHEKLENINKLVKVRK